MFTCRKCGRTYAKYTYCHYVNEKPIEEWTEEERLEDVLNFSLRTFHSILKQGLYSGQSENMVRNIITNIELTAAEYEFKSAVEYARDELKYFGTHNSALILQEALDGKVGGLKNLGKV